MSRFPVGQLRKAHCLNGHRALAENLLPLPKGEKLKKIESFSYSMSTVCVEIETIYSDDALYLIEQLSTELAKRYKEDIDEAWRS